MTNPSEQFSRPSIFDFVVAAEQAVDTNKYCQKDVLGNEASVEQFFVQRLLTDLKYQDDEIHPKETLAELTIARGRQKEQYSPDYALVLDGTPRWLIDAKNSEEPVDKWAYQGAGYALSLNQSYIGEDPCSYYVITNGLVLKVWRWNEAEPILTLQFSDFQDDSPAFLRLRNLLGAGVVRKGASSPSAAAKPAVMTLKKPSVEEAKRIFKNCHALIWKAEKINPQRAFFEFVKVMFVKLYHDKRLHEDPVLGPLVEEGEDIPRDAVPFSVRWIDSLQQQGVENPIDIVLFDRLRKSLADAVDKGQKKPIFDSGEHIGLHPGTLRQIVSRLERYDMFGIDEDLNGRLFETFLNATMRGQALGQFFTPRSIVKLIARAAEPRANREHLDHVIDACCGSGGFLIEALTNMRNEIRANTTLTPNERDDLNDQVANQALFGIDAGRDPPLARIARINMYLHGDGGSRIYAADSLDKTLAVPLGDTPQTETDELKSIIEHGPGFDIALTNPPFSMGYSRNLPNEQKILDQYDLVAYGYEGTSKTRQSLSSRVMFIERYADLLKPGGRLLTVIDDSTLSTSKYAFARQFIRDRFIVRAVISLPGDAFQRVGARAKTSVLYLVKRQPGEAGQPDVFMAESSYIGLDDVPPKTPASKADQARGLAEKESKEILANLQQFMNGGKGPWLVPGSALADRLDVKFCLPRAEPENVAMGWITKGYTVLPLKNIVDPITTEVLKPKDTPDAEFTFLRVRYDGMAEAGETRLGREITYSEVQRAMAGDLVVSNIAMALGATCVLPAELTYTLLSAEFTVMRVKDPRFRPWFLWAFLKSPEVRARLLSQATGISRHRVSWDFLKDIPVPLIPEDKQASLAKQYANAEASLRQAEHFRGQADSTLYGDLDLANPWALQRLRAAKPPK